MTSSASSPESMAFLQQELSTQGYRQKSADDLTSHFRTVKVWIETFAAHFRYFFDLTVGHVVQKSPEVRSCVHRLQLLFVEVQHFVYAPFVFELGTEYLQMCIKLTLELSAN